MSLNSRVCKDNLDETYADCSTPQEKTNADINAELGISDCEEDASDGRLNFNGSGMDVNCRDLAFIYLFLLSDFNSDERDCLVLEVRTQVV